MYLISRGGEEIIVNGSSPVASTKLKINPELEDIEVLTSEDLSKCCNPNLLDNWYFGNPVNQRNTTGWTSDRYFTDRWFCATAGNVFVGSDYISLVNKLSERVDIQQCIPAVLPNGRYTFSFMDNHGNVKYAVISYTADGTWHTATIDEIDVNIRSNNGYTNFALNLSGAIGNQFGFKAVKLEIGDKQTLAHYENGEWFLNEIPDYGEQLRRCQRYYHKKYVNEWLHVVNGSVLSLNVDFPVVMAGEPSIHIISSSGGTIEVNSHSSCVIFRSNTTSMGGWVSVGEYEATISGFGG